MSTLSTSLARRAILVGLDGASMEFVLRMVAEGVMPNTARLIDCGVHRPMLGVLPTLTPPGWTAIATGAWPGTHGVMDFGIYQPGAPLDQWLQGIDTRMCRAEYLWNTIERAGKKPVLIKWEMSWPPTVTTGVQVEGSGPGLSNYVQIAGYHFFVSGLWKSREVGGFHDPETVDPSTSNRFPALQAVSLENAEGKGWWNTPQSRLPPLEVTLTLHPLKRTYPEMARGKVGIPKTLYGYIYASGDRGYDRLRVCRSRDAHDHLAELAQGEWSAWQVETFEIDGKPVSGFLGMKLITLAADASSFELYVPQIWPTTGYTHPPEVADDILRHCGYFFQNPGRDSLGIIDDDTYFEQLEMLHQRMADIAAYLTQTRDPDWTMLFTETHAPDYAHHFFLPQADELSGAVPEVISRCREGLRRTYASIDRWIGKLVELGGEDTLVGIVSDHGGTPSQYRAIDVANVLEELGFLVYHRTPEGKRTVDWSRTRAITHGMVNIFINLQGRDPYGIVPAGEYHATQIEIINALHAYTDKITGRHPFALALTKDDAEMVNLWGDRIGDVIYALRPEFDGAHGKQLPSAKLGIGAQHSTFILAGPGVRRGVKLQRQVRVVDVAPTLCYLLGLPMPRDVEGGVVYEALSDPDWHLNA